MRDTKKGAVVLEENLSILVVEFIRSKGFVLADCVGVALGYPDELSNSRSFGILGKEYDAESPRQLLGLIKGKPRRKFFGVLWLGNPNSGWHIEANGREYLPVIEELAGEMASAFEVEIVCKLSCEESGIETFASDFSHH